MVFNLLLLVSIFMKKQQRKIYLWTLFSKSHIHKKMCMECDLIKQIPQQPKGLMSGNKNTVCGLVVLHDEAAAECLSVYPSPLPMSYYLARTITL